MTIPLAVVLASLLALTPAFAIPADTSQITDSRVEAAEKLIGLDFSPSEIDSMVDILLQLRQDYQFLRNARVSPKEPSPLQFNPVLPGMTFDKRHLAIALSQVDIPERPTDLNELAFLSIGELGEMLRTRKVSSVELTQMFVARLRTFGPELQCVITLTDQLALRQAAKADAEIEAGNYRGPLHGIPFGVKDLFEVSGYPTTYGTSVFKDRVSHETASVVQRLEEAGAVLVAKLSMGELAWGDVWYGGQTRNPWDLRERSGGSSAGPAAATAAGLVPFAIGTETWGSIISPSTRCGVTGLRPSFGRVSRHGAMSLSWTMDKVGPICRTAEDCAIVLGAITGPDDQDLTVVDLPFNYTPRIDLAKLRVGYVKNDFERGTNRANDLRSLQALRRLGVQMVEIELPKIPVQAMEFIVMVEAAASFDELTRTHKDDLLAQQMKSAWPNLFRASRLVPAVEYLQANRLRHQLMEDVNQLLASVDLFVAPTYDGSNLSLTNLTGHPSVAVPNGFDLSNIPTSITFVGRLYGEATLLAVARHFQESTGFHKQHPPRYQLRGRERATRPESAGGVKGAPVSKPGAVSPPGPTF